MKLAVRSFIKRIIAGFALLSVELLIVLAAFLVSLIVFLFVANQIFLVKKDDFDFRAFDFLSTYVSPQLTDFMKFVSFLASRNFITVACVVIIFYFLFIRRHKWYSLKIPVVAIGSISLNLLMKYLFNRPRPLLPHLSEAGGLSFPSGHAMMSFSFYGLMIFLVWENISHPFLKWFLIIFFFLLIHLIGLSRVYLRVHYASDVMAGFAVGLIWLVISVWTLRRIENYSKRNIQPEKIPIT